MHVCHVNPFFFPHLGGIERRIYHVSRALLERGHEVTVLTSRLPGTPKEETMDGFRVVRLPAKPLPVKWNPPILRTEGVEKALRDLAPDVLDFHYRWAPEYTKAVDRSGIPQVFTYHNTYGEGSGLLRPLSLANDRWNKRYVERAHSIAAISRFVRDDLARRGFPELKLKLVPNGCAPPKPGTAEWEADDGRELPRAPYFVAVGRLTPEKGTDLVIRAFAEANRRGANARLIVCGKGPERAALLRLARRLGVEDRVEINGWVPEATKFRLLQNATALVHMARFESFGIAIAEALVAGAPVVGADVGGVAEVVEDAGVVVPPGDTAAAGEALARLVADPKLRADLVERTRGRAKALAWSEVALEMEKLYRSAISS
ncbi:MAG TPA: glycosyltransferase family 4 protein [Candidatus Thermoplasmatota archaeon]|nr:glycosyltransferase family 4 protein [Candidatus Thermoplasmatota archaeon]